VVHERGHISLGGNVEQANKITNKDWLSLLTSLLLKRYSFKKHSCSNNLMCSIFKSKVAESVLSFARNIASTTEMSIEKANPCWLFCLPVLHFLQEKCAPFHEPPAKFNHDDRVPVWWGISEFKSDIENFKAKSVPWQRYHVSIDISVVEAIFLAKLNTDSATLLLKIEHIKLLLQLCFLK
jgi:hypothetical protein